MCLINRHHPRLHQPLLRYFAMVAPVLHQRPQLEVHYRRPLRRNSKTIFEYLVQGHCKALYHLLIVSNIIKLKLLTYTVNHFV